MKVIGAGFGRTGTLSLKTALERLRFDPCYHMLTLIGDASRAPSWQTAVDGAEVDWREVFAGFDATVDWPGCAYYKQLLETWPDAKVLLTVRDPDAWYESTYRSIYDVARRWRRGDVPRTDAPPDPAVVRVITGIVWAGTFDDRFDDRAYAIDVFNRHNEDVRATVPADQLLVHEVRDGWAPLCEFLGLPAPGEPFPRVNDTAAFREMMGLPALT